MGTGARRVAAAALAAAVCACLAAAPPAPGAGLAAAAFLASPAAALQAAGQAVAPAGVPGALAGGDGAAAGENAAPEAGGAAEDARAVQAVPAPEAGGAAEDAPAAEAGGTPNAVPALAPLPNSSDPAALLPLPADAVPEGMAPLTQRFYTQDVGGQAVAVGAGVIRNCTDLTNAQVAAQAGGPLPFAVEPGAGEPQVLIMHTHATECYEDAERSWADPAASARTTDTARNMVAVGAAMARVLNEAGICTIQDTTLHDYPSYTGSYAASNATVRAYLARYPGIKIVLDVHRDAIGGADGSRTKPVFMWNGLKCAQVMLICGADNGGNLPNYRQNLCFAAAWQSAMATVVPGLARPCLFDYRYYNQDLTTGSLLLEVGGHGNTLDEAIRGGELAARALAALLGAG